ncbi:MerR family transcriptional regulator [Cetobacterium somerae]
MIKAKRYPLSKFHSKIKKKYHYVITIKLLSQICKVSVKTIRRYLKRNYIYSTFTNNTHLIHVDSLILNFVPPSEKNILKSFSNFGFYPEFNLFKKLSKHSFCNDLKNKIFLMKSSVKVGLKKFICMRTLLSFIKF